MRLFKRTSSLLTTSLIVVTVIVLVAVCVVVGIYTQSTPSKFHQDQEIAASSIQEGEGSSDKDNLINLQQTPDSSFLYDVAIADLCSADTSYQKKVVQVKGEVVGHPIKAEQNPGKYWIMLKNAPGETEGSLSVLVEKSHLDAIDSYGDYNMRGTILSVKGVFHVACTSHEGTMDIHAENVSAVEAGYPMLDDFQLIRFLPGLFLCVVAVGLYFAYRSFAEGER